MKVNKLWISIWVILLLIFCFHQLSSNKYHFSIFGFSYPSYFTNDNMILFSARTNSSENEFIFTFNRENNDTKLLSKVEDTFMPRFSITKQKIVFTKGEDDYTKIYSMNSDGSETQQLTFEKEISRWPFFSADEETIFFVRSTKESPHWFNLYQINLDGSAEKIISSEYFCQPSSFNATPDGKYLIFSEIDYYREGPLSRRLIKFELSTGKKEILIDQIGWIDSKVTLDGQNIIFIARMSKIKPPYKEWHGNGVYKMDINGNNMKCILYSFTGFGSGWFDLSEDETKILFIDSANRFQEGNFITKRTYEIIINEEKALELVNKAF